MQVEELGLPLGELVLVDEGGVLGPVDGRDLRLQAHDQRGGGHGEVLGARHVVHPALQPLGERGGVAPVLHVLAGAAAGLGEADEQIGVAVVAQLLLVHVLEQEVLGVPGVVGGLGVHQAQIVPEGPHVVVVVGGPVNEVVLVEFARGPGSAERGVLGHGAREGLLQGHPELLRCHQLGHFVPLAVRSRLGAAAPDGPEPEQEDASPGLYTLDGRRLGSNWAAETRREP